MGIITGLISYGIQLGFNIIKALVFWLAFNYFAPFFSESVLQLPVTHISYWISLSFFFIVSIVGDVIQSLTPTIIKVENKTKEKT